MGANIAILLYVVDQTKGDGFAVSMISVAEFLPIFVFSFIGGALADRWNPAELFIGFVTPAFQVAIQTLILKNTEESFVGRVNGILTPLFMGAMVLTMSISGWLKDALSVLVMYEMAGVLFFISALITIPMFRMHVKPAAYEKVNILSGGGSR